MKPHTRKYCKESVVCEQRSFAAMPSSTGRHVELSGSACAFNCNFADSSIEASLLPNANMSSAGEQCDNLCPMPEILLVGEIETV